MGRRPRRVRLVLVADVARYLADMRRAASAARRLFDE